MTCSMAVAADPRHFPWTLVLKAAAPGTTNRAGSKTCWNVRLKASAGLRDHCSKWLSGSKWYAIRHLRLQQAITPLLQVVGLNRCIQTA